MHNMFTGAANQIIGMSLAELTAIRENLEKNVIPSFEAAIIRIEEHHQRVCFFPNIEAAREGLKKLATSSMGANLEQLRALGESAGVSLVNPLTEDHKLMISRMDNVARGYAELCQLLEAHKNFCKLISGFQLTRMNQKQNEKDERSTSKPSLPPSDGAGFGGLKSGFLNQQ